MSLRRFTGNPCTICGSRKGITYGASTKIKGRFISQHREGECEVCRVCKQSINNLGERLGDQQIHPSCTRCRYCQLHTSVNGEQPQLHNNYGVGWWKHPSCPRCITCGESERVNDKIIVGWAKDDLNERYHQTCLVCTLCNRSGVHPADPTDPVQLWTIEQADNIPYAHLACLRTRYCDSHKQYMPCEI